MVRPIDDIRPKMMMSAPKTHDCWFLLNRDGFIILGRDGFIVLSRDDFIVLGRVSLLLIVTINKKNKFIKRSLNTLKFFFVEQI